MSAPHPDETARTSESVQKQTEKFFEPQLAKLGLGKGQIERQTLEELEQTLIRVDEAIRNPESFGVLRIRIESPKFWVASLPETHIEIGVLPILLERKKLVLDRIRLLRGEEKAETLRGLVEKVSDEGIRRNLADQIDQLEAEAKRWQEQSREVEEAQVEEQLKVKTELARLQTEIFERKWKVWQSFLVRESVATIVGSFLLVVISMALIAAMFFGVETSEIVNNGFLVILGYFFGQSVTRKISREE